MLSSNYKTLSDIGEILLLNNTKAMPLFNSIMNNENEAEDKNLSRQVSKWLFNGDMSELRILTDQFISHDTFTGKQDWIQQMSSLHGAYIKSQSYTDKMEVSLCLWEAFLINQSSYPEIEKFKEKVGMAELRTYFTSLNIINSCLTGWRLINIEFKYEEPFDGYCPKFLSRCVEVTGDNLTLKNDWLNQCLSIAN
jgi:hypothetical protein